MMLADMHTHILPEMDDGSASVEESLEMLRCQWEQGVRHVAATPHFYARYDSPAHFLDRRSRAEEKLRAAMDGCDKLPRLTVGAEVYYYRGLSEWSDLSQFTIGGGDCVLIEMPQWPWPEAAFQELEEIWVKRGLLPVIAHVERYLVPFHTRRLMERLGDLPVLVQTNAAFFLEPSTARLALRLLRQERIHLLGSDCHNLTDRKPNLSSAVERITQKLGSDALDRIADCQNRVLQNT